MGERSGLFDLVLVVPEDYIVPFGITSRGDERADIAHQDRPTDISSVEMIGVFQSVDAEAYVTPSFGQEPRKALPETNRPRSAVRENAQLDIWIMRTEILKDLQTITGHYRVTVIAACVQTVKLADELR